MSAFATYLVCNVGNIQQFLTGWLETIGEFIRILSSRILIVGGNLFFGNIILVGVMKISMNIMLK